jgi:hypothetical protein
MNLSITIGTRSERMMTRSAQAMSRLYRWSDLPKLVCVSLLYMLLADWTSGNLSL